MNKYKNAIILVVILFGLGSGVMIGANINEPENNQQQSGFDLLEIFNSKQIETFLIVGVNDIHSSATELESLWLVETDIRSFKIDFMPIYPTRKNNAFQSPHQPIMVTPAGPVEIFDNNFVDSEIVDHIIILDKAAFWTLIELSDPSAELPIDHNQGTTFNDYPHVWENPIQALEYQIGIITYLCDHNAPFSESIRVEEMVKLINNYLFTDLTIEELLGFWQQLYDNDFNFECEIK